MNSECCTVSRLVEVRNMKEYETLLKTLGNKI